MMNMKNSIVVKIVWLMSIAVVCTCRKFDFFYFVQQWPGSYCNTRRKCCYPITGKPASDFSIHGLWPNYNSGSYPSNCDPRNQFNPYQIRNLTRRLQRNWPSLACPSSNNLRFWGHEWNKHGTCSKSILNQNKYFATALNLKLRVNLLQTLQLAGIEPNGEMYSLSSIQIAIKEGIGHDAWIECNVDRSRKPQIFQVYLCVDFSASKIIDCPVLPRGRACSSEIGFPRF